VNRIPWEVTDQYIRSGHRAASGNCRTITISVSKGIKAIYCEYESGWAIQSYLFSKDKWDLARAKAWFSSHKTESFHPDFQRIFSLFKKRYKDSATQKFFDFLTRNALNPEKRYHPSVQFQESFSWVRPLIQYYKKDKDARYWKILCLTANMSMNKNDYTDYTKMQKAAPTMNYRPVNINHDHTNWLPYPRTRMDFAVADELAVEGTLRVDNRDKWLQDRLDAGDFQQPSIEGRPIPKELGGGYHFTGLALLEKGVQLPGDPLTYIEPLFLNESLGKSTCKLINGKIICENKKEGMIELNLKEQVDVPTDPPLPKSCVCPECGTVEDNPKKHCEVLLCSKCQHQMKVNPRQNEPQPTGGQGHLPKAEEIEAEIEKIYNMIPKEALWDTAYKNDLPDSSFAVVLAGGKKNGDGKTVPRSLRKLPFKNAEGNIDRPHLAAALQAIKGARIGFVPPYASKAKPALCNAAKSLDMKSQVCGTAEKIEDEDPIFKAFNELFRDPLGRTGKAHPRFKTAVGTMKIQNKEPAINEQLLAEQVAHAKTQEKLIKTENELNDKTKEVGELTVKFQREIADLNEKLGAWETKDASFGEMQTAYSKLQDEYKKLLKEKLQIVDKNSELKHTVKSLTKAKEKHESTMIDFENDASKSKGIIEDLRGKLDKIRKENATSRQETRNEITNRARTQQENADLREKNAELAREISDLTEKRLAEAKQIQKLNADVIEARKKTEELTTVNEGLEKAKKNAVIRSKQTINEMKKAGYVRIKAA